MSSLAADLVPDPADSADQGPVIPGIHLPAEVVNVHVHDIGHSIEVELPHLLDNRGPCDRLPFVAHAVQRGGNSIELSPKEFALLEFLMRHELSRHDGANDIP